MTRTTTTFGHSGHCNEWDECESSFFLERTLFKDQIQVVFLLHRVIFFPGCLFDGCWLEWLLLPPPTHGGVASAGDATLIHNTLYTNTNTSPHSRAVTQYTYVYMIHIITNTNIWAHALYAYMFNVQLFIHSPDTFWCFPDSQCNATEILKSTLGGEPATLCCCVADRLKQTLRYLAH